MTYLSHKEYALLTWAESRAKELLGAHTGGPNEADYREKLEGLRKVILKIKHGGDDRPQKAKRRRDCDGHPSGLSGEHDVVLDAIQSECLGGIDNHYPV